MSKAKGKWSKGPRLYDHEMCEVIPEGKKWVSVTSYQNIIEKPALKQWAANMCSQEVIRLYEAGELQIDTGAILPLPLFNDKIHAARMAYRTASDKAKDIGTEVHDMAENYLLGEKVITKGRDEKVMICFNAFMDWVSDNSVMSIHGELAVAHTGYRYAGRLDQLCLVNGVETVVDFKTSSGFYPEHGMQNAAYLRAYERMCDKKVPGCIVAIFKKTGGKPVIKDISDRVDVYFEASMAALELWRSMQRLAGKEAY